MRLLKTYPSEERPGFVHAAGSEATVVERLSESVSLVEVRVPDASLVGDAWYDTIEVAAGDLEAP